MGEARRKVLLIGTVFTLGRVKGREESGRPRWTHTHTDGNMSMKVEPGVKYG